MILSLQGVITILCAKSRVLHSKYYFFSYFLLYYKINQDLT